MRELFHVRLIGETLSVLSPPMPELLPRGSMCDPPQTHSVPLSLNVTPYVPCTIPDPLWVDTMTQEPKGQSQARHQYAWNAWY